VRWPRLRVALEAALRSPEPLARRSVPAGEPDTSSTQPALLLVEDNEVNRLVTSEQLWALGYQVDAALDGAQALAAIARRRYGAVLMDCQMPVMDGYAAARAIRAQEREGERLPIIALTAHALAGEREKVLAAGMDDYLTKPVRPEVLRQALERVVTRGREHSTDAPAAPTARAVDAVELDAQVPRSREVIELFLTLVPRQIAELERAITSGDAGGARAHAHTLKGSALSLGARSLASSASELQRLAERAALSEAAAKLGELNTRFAHVRARLQSEGNG
jgi:CheY-like chemotaxis protein/HPt (histidine-containing phosphotransfer) domain-containing protein